MKDWLPDYPYEDLLAEVRNLGSKKEDRTGTGTISVFGRQIRFDLSKGFPLITTKKVFTKAIIHELLWFIKGDTNIKYLAENGVRIWNEWAYEGYLDFCAEIKPGHHLYDLCYKVNDNDEVKILSMKEFVHRIIEDEVFADNFGYLGPIYGKQWRDFDGVDQLKNAIKTIRSNSDSRRIIVSSWNPVDVPEMALPPCHCLYQFYVNDGKLSCQLYQRSADLFLGVPFNIASYALLTHMVAQVCELEVGDFVHTFGDAHIYLNHFDQVDEQLSREPYSYPELKLNPDIKNIEDFRYEDIEILNYKSHPKIKAEVSV